MSSRYAPRNATRCDVGSSIYALSMRVNRKSGVECRNAQPPRYSREGNLVWSCLSEATGDSLVSPIAPLRARV